MRELARAKGESMTQINAMEVKELQQEQSLLQAAKNKASADLEAAKAALAVADANAQKPPTENGVTLKGAERVAKNAGEILDAMQNAIGNEGPMIALQAAKMQYGGGHKTKGVLKDTGDIIGAGMHGVTGEMSIDEAIKQYFASRMNQANDVKIRNETVNLTGNQAQANYAAAIALQSRLQKAQEDLSEALQNAKGDVTASNAAFKKFNQQLDDVNAELKIKTGIGAQAAAAEDAKKSASKGLPSGDALVRVGNFLGTSRSGIENLAAEHVKIARQSLGVLHQINNKMGGNGTSYSGT